MDFNNFPRTRSLNDNSKHYLPYNTTYGQLRVGIDIKRLHICIVSKEFPPFAPGGGIGTLYYHLASELLLMGHYVTVVVPSMTCGEIRQGRFCIIFANRYDSQIAALDAGFSNNLNAMTSYLVAVSDLHKAHPIDIIETALWDSEALALAMVPSDQRPPIVLRLVTPFPIACRLNDWKVDSNVAAFFQGAERLLIEHADAVVPISNSIAKSIQTEYSIQPDGRWSRIECGIAHWPFFDVERGYASFHMSENIPAAALICSKLILFIGRLEGRKGIDLVLKAANYFLSNSDAHLIVAGRDVEGWTSRLDEFINSSIKDQVHLVGEIADSTRDKLLAKAYCLLFPSRYESFGLVPLEAFVHGVPVIGTRSGAIPEVVVDGVSGLLFEPDDVNSLSDCVLALLGSNELHQTLSKGARQRIQQLSARKSAIQTIKLYANLVS